MKVVNYIQGNDDSKILLTCTFLDCDEIERTMMDK